MKLYYAPGTCAVACWISLEWANDDYEVQRVDYNDPEYLKINQMGMVPAVDIGKSRAMTQADAILQYIVAKNPKSNLGADEGVENEFEFNEIMSFLTGDFHPAYWPVFSPGGFTTDNSEESYEAVRQAAYKKVDAVMEYLNNQIGDDDHVYKNKRTVADAYAYIMSRWSVKTPKSWKEYPNIKRFMEKMADDPVVKRIVEESEAK